jgi:hypothetical protein
VPHGAVDASCNGVIFACISVYRCTEPRLYPMPSLPLNKSNRGLLVFAVVVAAVAVLVLFLSLLPRTSTPKAIPLNSSMCCRLVATLNCSAEDHPAKTPTGSTASPITSLDCGKGFEAIIVPNGSKVIVTVYDLLGHVSSGAVISRRIEDGIAYVVLANGSTVRLAGKRAVFKAVSDACLILRSEPGPVTQAAVKYPVPGGGYRYRKYTFYDYRLWCPNTTTVTLPR